MRQRHYFKLYRKCPGAAWQAHFRFQGQEKWVGTGKYRKQEAREAAIKMEEDILRELAQQAAHNLVVAASGHSPTPPAAVSGKDGALVKVPELDLAKPAPKGSVRDRLDHRVAQIQLSNKSATCKRAAEESCEHLYTALGGFVNGMPEEQTVVQGEMLVAFYNNPLRFTLSGLKYAKDMRFLLEPLLDAGLSEEFFETLNRIEKQEEDTMKSDPFLRHHFQLLHRRLETGLEEDYFTGLTLIGEECGPQIIDAVLLQWEGVNFETNELSLYRTKTVVLAKIKMSPWLRAWLWRRRQEAPPDAVYVFWELVWRKSQRGLPGFNEKVVTNTKRIGSISSNAGNLWREFMDRADIEVGIVTLKDGEITNVDKLADKFRVATDPLCAWVVSHFTPKCRKILAEAVTSPEARAELEEQLIRNINNVIKGEYFFSEELFVCELRGGTQQVLDKCLEFAKKYKKTGHLEEDVPEILKKNLTGARLHHLNRLLLEDALPELARLENTNQGYTYSSFRRYLLSFLSGLGFRPKLIACIAGHEALSSQSLYDHAPEYEINRACEINVQNVQAMIAGKHIFYPCTPYDHYVKTMEQFQLQEASRLRIRAELEELDRQRHAEVLAGLAAGVENLKETVKVSMQELGLRWQQHLAASEQRHEQESKALREFYGRQAEERDARHQRALEAMEQRMLAAIQQGRAAAGAAAVPAILKVGTQPAVSAGNLIPPLLLGTLVPPMAQAVPEDKI